MSERLIIFTRYPQPHRSKTRLIPALGPEGATAVQREMTRYTLWWAQGLAALRPLSVEVHFEGGDRTRMERCFGTDFAYQAQGEGDLGRRMSRAFESAFEAGIGRTVLVGTDCPGLTTQLAGSAFDRLPHHDLVLGPAADGGYYLIGLRRPIPRLFQGICWGSAAVLDQTLCAARELGLSISLLARLRDVDRPQDLDVWNRTRPRFLAGCAEARISVVIPTLNEAGNLEQSLESLRGASNVETIVVDGGSRDRTRQIAESYGCQVLTTDRGRARQMNTGAAEAIGSILLFLHADTRLPRGFDNEVRRALGRPGVVAGAFPLRIDAPGRCLRFIERMANLRARCLEMPYGDQGIFMPIDVFYFVGAFPNQPIMEDFELMRRLRRRGRVALAPSPVVTSARRWEALGPWPTTWMNQKIVAAYCLGVSPQRLGAWYHGARKAC